MRAAKTPSFYKALYIYGGHYFQPRRVIRKGDQTFVWINSNIVTLSRLERRVRVRIFVQAELIVEVLLRIFDCKWRVGEVW